MGWKVFLGGFVFLSCGVSLRAQQLPVPLIPGVTQAPFDRYRETQQRIPFLFHTDGRVRLAQTQTPESLDLLLKDYSQTKKYQEHTRYTISHLLGRFYGDSSFEVSLLNFLKKENSIKDIWLWTSVLESQFSKNLDLFSSLEDLFQRGSIHHRAAVVYAMAVQFVSESSVLFEVLEKDFPKNEQERTIVIGAWTHWLLSHKQRVNDSSYRASVNSYVNLLEKPVALSKSHKFKVAKTLQIIFKTPAPFEEAQMWRDVMARGDVNTQSGKSHTVSGSRFFGIESDGERFCYVIDMSDSMCKKIDPSSKPSGPTTGPRKPKDKKLLDESDLPWHQINTRWDLAREQLKISLSRLDESKSFAVVWFGTNAGVFDSTKGLLRANSANINRIRKELDEVKMGPPDSQKSPDGLLRGSTNLHGGLVQAFGLSSKGFEQDYAFVNSDVLKSGCDTVFLLSDGAPSSDNFVVVDKDYQEGNVVLDVEYGASAQRTERLNYQGPYVYDYWILEDLRRLNAFRQIPVHTIGLGEANMSLLTAISKMSGGQSFQFGQKK